MPCYMRSISAVLAIVSSCSYPKRVLRGLRRPRSMRQRPRTFMASPVKGAARVLMSDVARAAGVVRVTGSRAISAPDSVAPATRIAVQQAVTRLGYVPNLNAGALASSRSHIVGAIVPTLSKPGSQKPLMA